MPKEQGVLEVIHVCEGKSFTLDQSVLLNLQKPKKVPTRGGLPLMVILRKARSHLHGANRAYYPPTTRLPKGMVIFLPDEGLSAGQELVFVWATDSSAAAVPVERYEKYKAEYDASQQEAS